MSEDSPEAVKGRLLERYGQSFAEEAGIRVERNTPSVLFQLLCFSLLASARIGHDIAMSAAKALFRAGWRTPGRMAESTWRQRTDVLNGAGYARYDESTSRMLGETTQQLLEQYDGDLRKLREAAGRDRDDEARLLRRFKGIGAAGADMFLREVQLAWEEVYPFVDGLAMKRAREIDLAADEAGLCRLAGDAQELVRLNAALIRAGFEGLPEAVSE